MPPPNPTASTPTPAASTPATAAPVPLAGIWHVRVLGGLEARNGDLRLTHFVSQPIAGLLARLAMQPQRSHAREELVELLWPGVQLDVGRNRLRNAISSLRRLLEPPGVAAGSVLLADRQSLRLAPQASQCDAIEFERAVRAGHAARARGLYLGELLPGFYEEWVQEERARLAALLDRVADTHQDAHPHAHPDPDSPAAAPGLDAATTGAASAAPVRAADAWLAPQPALPTYLTTYFGRETERSQLLDLIGAHRLVTLSGAGGCGKTRLAVEVGRVAPGFDSVAFVALADCADADQVIAQLRVALQIRKGSGDALIEAIGALRDRPRPLLVLDNFEQLVNAGGVTIVDTLLDRVPALHLLVTSRRVLGLAGEHEFALHPLPQPQGKGTVEQTARSPSVSMFVDRARSVRPDFQVTARNHEDIAALCRALEGLPLAIELAASRSRAFTPADMHAALAQRFSLLARSGARNGRVSGTPGARHDSLRAAIDWSWRLLEPHQQRFLLALSVFRGGWSANSAQAVSDEPQAHALLESLTADSLLRSETDAAGAMRFFMLEMIREYLRDHLREQLQPADALRLRQRHRAHFLAHGLALGQRSQAAAHDDLSNFVEALQTAVDDGEPGLALALGVALRGEWEQHGMPAPVQALLERALTQQANAEGADGPGAEGLVVHAHLVLRAALLVAGESDAAQVHATQALALAGTQPALRAAALLGLARQLWERSRDVAAMRPLLAEALTLARQERASETEGGVLATLATVKFHSEDGPIDALTLYDEAQHVYELAGIEHAANRVMFMKANCHAKLHQYATSLALLAECEQRFLAAGHVAALPELANVQGFAYAQMVRWRDAELAFTRCALGAARQQNRYMMTYGLWNLPRPLAHRRFPEAAGLLMAFSARYWVANFGALVPSDLRYIGQIRRLIRVQVGAAEVERIWQRAEAMTLPAALELVAQSLAPLPGDA